MKEIKIHHATIVFEGNESDSQTLYSPAACGVEEFEEHTSNWEYVTCKKCLKKKADCSRAVTNINQ